MADKEQQEPDYQIEISEEQRHLINLLAEPPGYVAWGYFARGPSHVHTLGWRIRLESRWFLFRLALQRWVAKHLLRRG